MKRIILPLLLLAASSMLCRAASPASLFDEFKDVAGAEYVSIPPFMMSCAKVLGCVPDDVPAAGSLKAVKVLSINGASEAERARFNKRLKSVSEGMDELVRVKDDDSSVRIITKADADTYHDIYILATDGGELAFIELKGKFSQSDIKKMMQDEK
ncbi:MAG: DUF4252 domain-containing protein [Muribaculaceae bacterium]|nr:DUF4252 domain-containing protein [Muribaculaceae bacterium]